MLYRSVPSWVKNVGPSIVVICLGIIVSFFLGHSGAQGGQVIVKILLRFLKIAAVLCIPLWVLFPVYRRTIGWKKNVFIHVQSQQELSIDPVKHWLFRPFQGIGIVFLFRSKLLAMLQIIAGPSVPSSLVIPRGDSLGVGFLVIYAITAFVALFLSVLWTLDDMGIRYFNKRDHELKMVGKYVGTLMPMIFGLYGIFGLMANYALIDALLNIVRAVVILYPPFVLFTVLHAYYIRHRTQFLYTTSVLKHGEICLRG